MVGVIGIGNILLQDEGFGVHVINFLNKNYSFNSAEVQLIDGSTMGYGLLDTILNLETAIIIDALKTDDKPGSIYKFHDDDLPANLMKKTAHEVEFIDVITMCGLTGFTPKLIFFAVVPQNCDNVSMELTEPLKLCISSVADDILKELKSFNIIPLQ
jgi:hydrogenase maturation protease